MVTKALRSVYQRDQRVFIPDFGFILHSDSSNGILFNKHLTLDDGKLINEIAEQENISEEKARGYLKDFIQEVKTTTQTGQSFSLGDLGSFQLDEEGELIITTDPGGKVKKLPEIEKSEDRADDAVFNDLTEDPIPSPEPVPRPATNKATSYNYSDVILPEENELVTAYYERKKRYEKKPGRKFPVLLIFILILIVSAVALYYFKIVTLDDVKRWYGAVHEKAMDVFEDDTEEVPEAIVIPDAENSELNNIVQEASYEVAVPDAKEVVIDNENITNSSASSEVYFIVLGSFKVEANAHNFLNTVRSKGLGANKISKGGYYLVGVNINGKEKAIRQLQEIRHQYEPRAWLKKMSD